MEFESGRVIGGFLVLIFMMVIFVKLTDVATIKSLGVTGDLENEQIKWYLNFFKPLALMAILTLSVAIIFPGTGAPEAIMLGLTGIVAYLTFSSQWFFSIIGLSVTETSTVQNVIKTFAPVILSAMMISIAMIFIKFKD